MVARLLDEYIPASVAGRALVVAAVVAYLEDKGAPLDVVRLWLDAGGLFLCDELDGLEGYECILSDEAAPFVFIDCCITDFI